MSTEHPPQRLDPGRGRMWPDTHVRTCRPCTTLEMKLLTCHNDWYYLRLLCAPIWRQCCLYKRPSRSCLRSRISLFPTALPLVSRPAAMLRVLALQGLPAAALATNNYCQWAANITNGTFSYGDYGGYINRLYLFDSSACNTQECIIPQSFGASVSALDQRPSSEILYTCDGTAQFASYLLGLPGVQTHYICTVSTMKTHGQFLELTNQCTGTLPSTTPLIYLNGSINVALDIPCSNANGSYCGPFPMQTYYCGTSGSVSNDARTEKFSNYSTYFSCDCSGGCVSHDMSANTQHFTTCDGGTGSQGETLYGDGGSASASTTNSCGLCVLDPSRDPRCASKFASSGSGTTAPNNSAENGSGTTASASTVRSSKLHDICHRLSPALETDRPWVARLALPFLALGPIDGLLHLCCHSLESSPHSMFEELGREVARVKRPFSPKQDLVFK